jgi:cytochrome c oxidase subunit 3
LAFVAHRIKFAFFIFAFAIFFLVYASRQWLFDVEDEASLFGYHTLVIKKGLYRGFILFVVSEVMLFFGFFWAFFHFSLSPSYLFALIWPYDNAFVVVNCLGFPAYNTILLIVSGITVTYAHYALASSRQHEALDALYLTVFLGLLFLISQINEYFEIAYNLNDSSYSCVFYMLTGLHGMHVFIGVSFLYVCLERLCLQDFTINHYLGFVCAI